MNKARPFRSACLLALGLAACGPSLLEVRKSVARSPHRVVAVFPFETRAGQANGAELARNFVETKLRNDGFQVVDRGKTMKVFNASLLRNGVFDAAPDAAELGKALGAKAALIGAVLDAYERVDRRPAEYRYDPVAPPACCHAPKNPCAPRPVYDPSVAHYVDDCQGTHRQVLTAPASSERRAGLSLSLRLVDTQTKALLWQGAYAADLRQAPLRTAADQVTDILLDQLADAFLAGKL